MEKLLIEWKHFDKEGKTCFRCRETGVHLKQSIRELKASLLEKGVEIKLRETKLTEDQMDKSNSLLFDGVPIENVLSEVSVLRNTCDSCGDLAGNPCDCRAVQTNNVIHEAIPKKIIKQAILMSLRL